MRYRCLATAAILAVMTPVALTVPAQAGGGAGGCSGLGSCSAAASTTGKQGNNKGGNASDGGASNGASAAKSGGAEDDLEVTQEINSDGNIETTTCTKTSATDLAHTCRTVIRPPQPGQAVSPAVLAQQLIAQIQLRPITIGIAPEDRPGRMGLVGLPVWMWVQSPTANTYGPLTDSVTAGGITVSITATVDRIEWDMGDGTPTVVCGLGTPYADHYGKKDSPSCGHRYERTSGDQPDNAYTVQARSYWTVRWQAGTAGGVITPAPQTATARVRIGELQVLQR